MPILPLPKDTSRLLGAALAITSPLFLVKELLDNAIDAGATAVEIFVSQNTLEKVEVRDNGSGISPSDFDLLGRPGHTSKLTSLKDLETVGCKSLGFRGVALASAAALADISICTRTSAEPVATILQLSREGVTNARGQKSTPVGTSVCVTSLFGSYPVRYKRAASEATATILKIKGLLECYALARPQIKLSFKVLGGKQWWSYVPSSGGSLKDAVIQVMGRELAAQCMLRTWSFTVSDNERGSTPSCSLPATDQSSHFVFEAYLPSPAADVQKICKGAFVSVDSRPLSFTQGTAKKLKKLFEKHFKRSLVSEDSSKLAGNLFIRLDIRCPGGFYDPNVEPSKYDVLFHDEELLIRQFEEFLTTIYPAKHEDTSGCREDISMEEDGDACKTSVPNQPPPMSQKQHGRGQALTTPPTDDDTSGNSKEGLNPWTIAKLVAPRRQTHQGLKSPTRNIEHVTPEEAPPFRELPMEVSPRRGSIHRPLRRTQPATKGNYTSARIPTYSPPLNVGPTHSQSVNRHNSRPEIPLEQFSYTSRGHGGRPLGMRPHSTHAGQGTGMVQSKISFGGTRLKRPRKPQMNVSHELEPLGNLGSDAYDGVARRNVPLVKLSDQHTVKRANNDGRRKSTARTREESLAGVPDNGMIANRKTFDDLSIIRDCQKSPEASLAKNDPRNYLMRRQRSLADNPQRRKIQRLKTNLLPLETTPLGFETHKLALSVHINPQTLARNMAKTGLLDSYLIEGAVEDSFRNRLSQEEVATLETRVKFLLTQVK
ncbi:hypothetical protein B0T20DRAFT_499358, partial [Sordaria brevicollis]